MHSKLSMKNLQTFGQDNPFLKQGSLASISKSQFQSFRDQNINPSPTYDDKQKRIFPRKNHNEYQMKILQESSNMGNQSQRQKSSSKQSHKPPKKFNQLSSLPKFNPTSKTNPYSCNQIIYLLSNQQQCLNKVKKTVQNDKQKINYHFIDFKQTINNIIDDLKISICASVDTQYQHFVNQFRIVKVQYGNYCNIKRQFWAMREGVIEKAEKCVDMGGSVRYPGMVRSQGRNQIDNQMLLLNMIQDIKDCKKHMNYVQFAEIQQKILKPLLKTVKDMIKQMQIQSYYNPEISHNTFKILQQSIENNVHKMYERMDLFINDHMRESINQKNIMQKSKRFSGIEALQEKENVGVNEWFAQEAVTNRNNKLSSNYQELNMIKTRRESSPLEMQIQSPEIMRHPLQNITNQVQMVKKQTYNSTANTQFTSTHKSKRMSIDQDYIQEKSKIAKTGTSSDNNLQGTYGRQTKLSFNYDNKSRKSTQVGSNLTKPNIKLQECRSIVDKNNKQITQQQPETALCVLYLPLNKIAVGTKSGTVKLFCTKTGSKLTEFHGHRASICSLAYIPQANYLVSGSDIGCCQLIIWQLHHNTIYHNFGPVHKAAITTTIPLTDNKHILTGSFDNCLNIYNYRKKQLIKSINTGQKITLLSKLTDTKGEQLIISGNLNSQICVWKLCRNTFNSLGNVVLVRKINIGTYPYAIVEMGGSGQVMVAGRDDWLRVVNIQDGSIDKASEIGQYQQLISIKTKTNPNIYLGLTKNNTISTITPTQHNLTQQILTNKINTLTYSCGINPKSALSPQNYLYVANHNSQQTEIKVWRVVMQGSDGGMGSEYY